MDKQNSKKDTPKKNRSTRPLYDPTDGIQQAKEDSRTRHRYGSQSEHYAWGLSWPQFLGVVLTTCAIVATIIAALMQRAETLSTQEKERARVVFYGLQRDSASSALSFSLTFKNVGETPALNTYGVWLRGECQYTSRQECVEWCLQPLRETPGNGYGPLISQDEHREEFSYTLKTDKARQKQLPIYFCGYFAYTDVFCMWRRQFYVFSYTPDTDQFSPYTLTNEEEEGQEPKCSL